jgi:outer membrane protein OmpA-like peptidoglycan-associated protein
MAYFSFGRQTRAFVGGGGTVIPGEGGPAWRVTAGVSTRRGAGPGDMDGDGVPDATDLCPSVDEDMDGFKDTDGCLDPDNDDDGVPDTVDRCVDKAEYIDGFTDGDGCPDLDNDHDGLLDTEDMCPDQPGSRETEGCPDSDGDGVGDATDECPDRRGSIDAFGCSDRDGDHVPDHRDRCPDEKADPRIDPRRSDGCPGRAFVTTSRIEILDRVLFDTGSSVIKAESYAILEEVARIMRADPGLRLVEVAGHTDDVGSHEYNQRLSELRAAAVRRFLTERGIDPRRLDSEGYGETRPVAPNDSEDGRARNRRVEFVIKEVGKR